MGILKHIPEQIGDRIPKVYFSCHKDDFKPYFKEISAEITKGRNCAIFYDEDYEGDRDEHFYFDLSQMNLFVMPITTRLLTKPNRALGEELAFAIEKKIPILPLMQESGLEELYKQKFGDLQFLDKNKQELGAISYEEKLDKYLSSILLNDEMIKRIRAEFDAQIFLSYRKKDRIHANRLMRLIHKNDFCRDIAIWYDEFLTPGENFNDNIRKALDKSGLFVLAVTPSLLEPRIDEEGIEHKNYIEEHEYPMAKDREREKKIAILPAELVKTDKDVLAVKYANIPDCVNAEDENALTEALLNTAKKLVNDENDNSPEHNYLIGLAYLNGIDVEVDHARALEMIEFAANADYIEAIDKMIEMYSNGIGTERNYETAIQWHERKIGRLKEQYSKYLSENKANGLFDALIECGNAFMTCGQIQNARIKYIEAMEFNSTILKTGHFLILSPHKDLVKIRECECCVAIATCFIIEGVYVEAKKHALFAFEQNQIIYNRALTLPDLSRRAQRCMLFAGMILSTLYVQEGNHCESNKYSQYVLKSLNYAFGNKITTSFAGLAGMLYAMVGDNCIGKGDIVGAKDNYLKARGELNCAPKLFGTKWLTICVEIQLGEIFIQEDNFIEAESYLERAINMSEVFFDEENTPGSQTLYAMAYALSGKLHLLKSDVKVAKEHLERALILASDKNVAKREDVCRLLVAIYECLGIMSWDYDGNINDGIKYLAKAHEIALECCKTYDSIKNKEILRDVCVLLGKIYADKGCTQEATKYFKESLDISQAITKTVSTADSKFVEAEIYCELAEISEKRKNLEKAQTIMKAVCEEVPENTEYLKLKNAIQKKLIKIYFTEELTNKPNTSDTNATSDPSETEEE